MGLETRFVRYFRASFKSYRIETSANLLYKLFIDSNGELQPKQYGMPIRGQLAFQTEILIRNERVPLVVIETKFGGFTTHDVLTYSAKAVRHKEIYPYLRYGLLIGESDRVDKKFFIHNLGFDFALAIEDLSRSSDLIEVVRKQIVAAEQFLEINKMERVAKYTTSLEIA